MDMLFEKNLINEKDFHTIKHLALQLYNFGVQLSETCGLILVDTKYEFGKDAEGNIILVDELHTPDSSRYWLKKTYSEKFSQALEPDSFDKEFFRLWFKNHCNPYNDKILPIAPKNLIIQMAGRYIQLHEMLMDSNFNFKTDQSFIHLTKRIRHNITTSLKSI